MTLLKDLKVGDIVFVEENKVPAKFLLVDKHAEYTTECGTTACGIALVRMDPLAGTLFHGHPILIVSENGTWIDNSGILHGNKRMNDMKTLLEANIGEIVKIRENNIPTEFIVIQKGDPFLNNARYENGIYILPKDIPSPAYIGFRHGVTLLRKDIHSVGKCDPTKNNYANSEIHKWCNGTYLNTIQKDIRKQIMTVKIPYRAGITGSIVSSGMNGLSCRAFILSAAEINYKDNYVPNEGVVFSYFKGGGNSKRIANLNGSPNYWWLRSPNTRWYDDAHCVNRSGNVSGYGYVDNSFGRRPVIVLPETISIDNDGNLVS